LATVTNSIAEVVGKTMFPSTAFHFLNPALLDYGRMQLEHCAISALYLFTSINVSVSVCQCVSQCKATSM